jgi:hypothetical protein
MKNLFKKSSPVAWFLLGILVAGGTGTAYAANGGTFRLGYSNKATATTKLTNTKGTGIANAISAGYDAWFGEIVTRNNGSMVAAWAISRSDGNDTREVSPNNPLVTKANTGLVS